MNIINRIGDKSNQKKKREIYGYENKIGTKLKDYLNADEVNAYMYHKLGFITMPSFRRSFAERGNMTKEEHKLIKLSETYLGKFIKEFEKRLSEKTVGNINKRIDSGYYVKVIDKYTNQRLIGSFGKELEVVKMPRNEFEDWCEEVMDVKCKNCTITHKECNLHDTLFNNFVPESGYECESCRYKIIKEENKEV